MKRVVVVGRDAALWLTVAALRRGLAATGVGVEAVELPTALAPAAVHATLPALEALHAKIGLDEAMLLRGTGGAFSMGQNFVASGATAFFHAWSTYGAPIGGASFFPVWTKARRYGLPAALQDFNPAAAAAKNGRLLIPDDETAKFGRVDYAYHLPARYYVGVLKGVALRLGATAHRTAAVEVERDGDTVLAVTLDDGRRIEGDLFVDASGADGVLSGPATRTSDGLPVDRRLIARMPALPAPPPYADMRVVEHGWLGLYPTAADTRVQLNYRSDLLDDEAAMRVASDAARAPLSNVTIEPLAHVRSEAAWIGNRIAIGGSSDPIHDVELHAAQLGIVHLLSLFPASESCDAERAEYNRITRSAFARLHDFQAAAYALAPYEGAFWDRARAVRVSPELAHRIAIFRARGEIAPMEDETFLDDSWRALFVGLGVEPESWPPAIDRIDPETIKAGFRGMLGFIREQVLQQPSHADYLARIRRSGVA